MQGKVAWFDKNKNLMLVEIPSVYLLADVDKIATGQKTTVIIEQRQRKPKGLLAELKEAQ